MYDNGALYRRYTKREIYQMIQMACYQSTGVNVSSVIKIEDAVPQLRHSCLYTGVCFLPQYVWQVPTDTSVINIPYYFCTKCGKLFIYNNIYV